MKNKNGLSAYYLEISIKDLQTSRILYENKFYAPAIFYIQQSLEKLIKSNGYYLNIIAENNKINGKPVTHSTWKIYCQFWDNLKKSKYKRLLCLNQKRQKEMICASPVLIYIFEKYKKDNDLRRINFNYLFNFLSQDDNRKKIKNLDFSDEIISKTIKKNFVLKDDISNLMDQINFEDNGAKQNSCSKSGSFIKIFWSITSTAVQLIGMLYYFSFFSIDISIILFKYVDIARYGNENILLLPSEILTKDHILIKEYKEIYKIIQNMQKLFGYIEKSK